MEGRTPKLSFWNKFNNIALGVILLYIGASMVWEQEAVRGYIILKGPMAIASGVAFGTYGLILLAYTIKRITRE